jgi:hypothetical protein
LNDSIGAVADRDLQAATEFEAGGRIDMIDAGIRTQSSASTGEIPMRSKNQEEL